MVRQRHDEMNTYSDQILLYYKLSATWSVAFDGENKNDTLVTNAEIYIYDDVLLGLTVGVIYG